jgi:predicted PurR-regulated permease PerM
MDTKKMNKKGVGNIYGILFGMILVIGIFSGFILFYNDQLSNNDAVLDSTYNTTYNQLLEVQTNLDTRVNKIKDSVSEAQEVESGFLAAINGFKGIGESMLLLRDFTGDSIDVTESIFISADIVPAWAESLAVILLIALVIFIIIDIIIGRRSITA